MTGRSMDTGCDVIKRHVTPKGFPWKGGVCACATESCAIFALVGPFHRGDVIKRHLISKGFLWKGGVRNIRSSVTRSTSPGKYGIAHAYRKCPSGAL
jgi:hypothetical protein